MQTQSTKVLPSFALDAVIFDMDGLMLDTEPIYHYAWRKTAASFGYTLDDAFFLDLIGRKTEDCEAALLEVCGNALPMDKFRAQWPQEWHAYVMEHGLAHKPGLLDLLEWLEAAQIRKAVATSSTREEATFSLNHAGIHDRFEVVITGDQVVHGKPAPDIYLLAAKTLDVDPTRCIALEDSEAGTRAASGAGMCALMVPDLKAPSAEVTALAYRVLPSLYSARDVIESVAQ